MSREIIIAILIGGPALIASLLTQITLWQRKEYRLDRMRSFLASDDGRTYTHNIFLLTLWTAIAVGWLTFLLGYPSIAAYVGWVGILASFALHAMRVSKYGLMRPVWTLKAISLTVVSVLIVAAYLQLTTVPSILFALQIATALFFMPGLIALATAVNNIPFALQKQRTIAQAAQLRQTKQNLTVIGITGSVGKTSTKHFLIQLLAQQNVAATVKHRNSEYSVALDMLAKLSSNPDIYVAEMGAYRKNEIQKLATLTQPAIGVLTEVGNQHIDLFGSQKNIVNAKWELIDALPSDGTAVLNADNEFIVQKAQQSNVRTIWFSAEKPADVYAEHITYHESAVSCTLHINDEHADVIIPVAGKGALMSALAAISTAYAAGSSAKRLVSAITKIQPYEQTMNVTRGIGGVTVIDDSYSASENSVINAVRHLAHMKSVDKRIALVPILELGTAGPDVHRRIGKILANSNADVYIYGKSYKQYIKEGAGEGVSRITWTDDPNTLIRQLTKNVTDHTTILLEGRVPAIMRRAVMGNQTPAARSNTPIITSLSPNAQSDDIRLAARTLISPTTWRNKEYTQKAAERLAQHTGNTFVALKSSGRQALFDVLRALHIGKGDEVIMQAFTCIAVPEPVLWVGAHPVYADIAQNTFTLDPQRVEECITNKTKAIIVQHTFGIPAPIHELRALARRHGVYLIEDCAHALGSTVNNKSVGTFGDAAIWSFGRDKSISSVYGGAVTSDNQQLITSIRDARHSREQAPYRWVAQQLLHPIIMSAVIPTYYTTHLGKALLVASQKIGLVSKAVQPKERVGKKPDHIEYSYSPALARLAINQLNKVVPYTQHRKRIARYYQDNISHEHSTHPEIPPHSDPAWLRYPLLVPEPRVLIKKAAARNIMLGNWYDAPLVPSTCSLSAFEYEEGSCPNAEHAAEHIINLPTHIAMDESKASRVVDVVLKHVST